MSRERRLRVLKIVPGFIISALFIWWTFIHKHSDGTRGFDPSAFRQIHLVAPVWIAGLVAFGVLGYGARCYRAWLMLRRNGAKLGTCSRVFMTSLAANNILPFRLGDVMRIFSYAPDVNASPSVVLGTVVLEKLLDVLMLVLLLVATLHTGAEVDAHTRLFAEIAFVVSLAGVVLMVAGARALTRQVKRLFKRLPAKLHKIEHWLVLLLGAMADIGLLGMVWLLAASLVAWLAESAMYYSAMRTIGMTTASGAPLDWGAPMQTVSLANFAFLVPSAPGGIGPFEWACQNALKLHGVDHAPAALFGLMIHAWLLLAITAVGGSMFLAHRLQLSRRRPLLEEIDTLPARLP
ncbi:MAG TPA: lysylphosphatidylglycerol synthase transmembrane domain-containing protein [Acidobacteriaceae bacterium]|jgi:hypothetical protein